MYRVKKDMWFHLKIQVSYLYYQNKIIFISDKIDFLNYEDFQIQPNIISLYLIPFSMGKR